MLKVLTGMEEPSVAQGLSRLFSGGKRRIKECIRALPLANWRYSGLSLWVELCCLNTCLKYFRTCSCKRTLKISVGL